MAHFTTCAQLTANLYPADTTTWFDAAKNPQIVLYAHMLYPLRPDQDALNQGAAEEAWHPPMVYKSASPTAVTLNVDDQHFAEAQWLDPDGQEFAHYGLTMPARVSTDYVRLQGRQYIPHTFAMTVGTKDMRSQAGQKGLPSKAGQYHIRLYVDGQIEGIAFFRMMTGGAAELPKMGMAPPGGEAASSPRALTLTPEESGLNALRDVFRALTKTGK